MNVNHLLLLITLFAFAGCTTLNTQNPQYKKQIPVSSKHKNMHYTGMVKIDSDADVTIILNWKSKSRVILKVTGTKKDMLKPYDGKVIVFTGTIKKTGQWNGTVDIFRFSSQ